MTLLYVENKVETSGIFDYDFFVSKFILAMTDTHALLTMLRQIL